MFYVELKTSSLVAFIFGNVFRFGSAGQEVSRRDQDDSEDDAHGLRQKTGPHPGAHQD